MIDLIDPRATALQFYLLREVQHSGMRLPYLIFEEKAGPDLHIESAADDCRRSTWQTAAGDTAQLDWTVAHDTHILRISLTRTGAATVSAWNELNARLSKNY